MRYYTSEEAILVRSVFIFRSPLLLCAIKKAHFANVLTTYANIFTLATKNRHFQKSLLIKARAKRGPSFFQ